MPAVEKIFAAIALPLEPQGTPGHGFTTTDMLIIASVAMGVAGVLVIWLVFFRKKPEYDYPVPADEKVSDSTEKQPPQDGKRRRRRKRRRVRDHRPRNPTLQQTGGLPPQRPEDQAPPY